MARTASIKKSLISPKKAVDSAIRYFREITGESVDVSIEEVELSKDEKKWIVTLGYRDTRLRTVLYESAISYKTFEIDALSGKIISMKIRKL